MKIQVGKDVNFQSFEHCLNDENLTHNGKKQNKTFTEHNLKWYYSIFVRVYEESVQYENRSLVIFGIVFRYLESRPPTEKKLNVCVHVCVNWYLY